MPSEENHEGSIAALRAGQPLHGVFAVTRKDRLMTRGNRPYLALELRDRSGTIAARAFTNADALAGRFERGDIVRVSGRVERFREDLVVEISDIARAQGAEADPARFLPVAYRDLDELEGFLEHLASEVYDRALSGLLDAFLEDRAIRAALRRAPCSRNGHHAYLGGLLEHTVAVATLAREACILHPGLNSDLLLAAALLHDIGRTREFTYAAEIGLTEEGRLLGHLVIGERMISERARGLDDARRLAVLHCVLAHHGPATAPQGRFHSVEALALARINALDAGVKGALEHGLGAGDGLSRPT